LAAFGGEAAISLRRRTIAIYEYRPYSTFAAQRFGGPSNPIPVMPEDHPNKAGAPPFSSAQFKIKVDVQVNI
jgi:hypothetical protein